MRSPLHAAFDTIIDDLLDRETVWPQDIAVAQATIRAYRDDESAAFAWTGLDKAKWCARIELLLARPQALDQGSSDYCMPAAALFVLLKTIPETMASFCVGLGREGRGEIRDLVIEMTAALREFDLAAHVRDKFEDLDAVDYVLLLAMQNEMSVTAIDSPTDYAASPGLKVSDVSDLLLKTDMYIVTTKDNPTLADFTGMDARAEAVLLANMSLFSQKALPEHAAVLVPPVTESSGQVTLRFWSWGLREGTYALPIEGDAYVNRLSTTVFNNKVRTVVFVKPQG